RLAWLGVWACGSVTEGSLFSSLGWVLPRIQRAWRGDLLQGALFVVIPATLLAMIKPYVLFPLLLGAGVWFYWQRSIENANRAPLFRPFYLIGGFLIAIGGIVALGEFFPAYAIDSLAQQTAHFQEIGETVEGGSNYSLGAETMERSVSGQLAFAPLALVTALFRPFIFE